MEPVLLRDKIRGCLAGAAIGDALGMPVETMTRVEILDATGGRGVEGFLDPLQRKIEDTRWLPAGTTTDDTLLTLSVAYSLAARGKFNLFDQARNLVATCEASSFNFGRSTAAGAHEIGRWFKTCGKSGRHPLAPAPAPEAEGEGMGNGVAMKIAPLALHHAVLHGIDEVDPLLTDTMELGLMTHGDPRASFAAYALAALIGRALLGAQMRYNDIVDLVLIAETRYQWYRRNEETVSDALVTAKKLVDSPAELRRLIGTGGSSLKSVIFSIATFFRHQSSFKSGVLEAVNAGGDADTTASMVGAAIGAQVGYSRIPANLAGGVRGMQSVLRAADDLADSLDVPK